MLYIFEAHYMRIDSKITTKTIEVDTELFDTLKDAFIYAMCIAYENIPADEIFKDLELIAC